MAYKVDATLIDNLDDPPIEMLNYLINLKQDEQTRLDKLHDYYIGKQAILDRKIDNPHSKNTKVMVNHAKYITDMMTGMITGNPINYVSEDDENIKPIVQTLSKMDIMAHDTELERDLSCYGVAYELLYLSPIDDEHTQEKIALLDPRNTFVVTDDTEDANELFGVYILPKQKLDGSDNGALISVYTQHKIVQYRTISGNSLLTGNIQAGYPTKINQFWGAEPITEYKNNEQMQGDFEQQITSIDAYNSLQSDRISDKDAFVDAILLAYGTTIDGDIGKGQMLDGLPSKDEGTSIEWLTKTLDENQTQTLSDSIANDIHEMSNVPNMNDQQFAGNVSGEAMKYKLFGLLNLIAGKEQLLIKGLHRRLQLLQNDLNLKAQSVDASLIKVQISPNIPINLTDVVNNIKTADGVIPRLITYGWLPDGYDPQKMIEMMQQQSKDNIANQQEAMGSIESTASVDDDQGGYRDDNSNDESSES
ncbi:phage portal protein [Secundilactobacillus pentosiphilus]|uniref:Phage portal protein n=1 Tax=Secundilactobacillus pentosiphilus TaxID=1714682 RepID=A0A1Z5IZG5_9LACO|nr:phage portal protein [Secundilactobacillus pentosiphilus]GAX07194.1 phage portal protein [Secundilactobacillus pentosiphilus]